MIKELTQNDIDEYKKQKETPVRKPFIQLAEEAYRAKEVEKQRMIDEQSTEDTSNIPSLEMPMIYKDDINIYKSVFSKLKSILNNLKLEDGAVPTAIKNIRERNNG